MWPWEHLAFGYVLYSASRRARGETPADGPTLALALSTQLPDLVDKPLSWGLGLFPVGYSVAHSVVVAVPAVAVAYALAVRRGRRDHGGAVAVGYFSHLVGDVLSPMRSGAGPAVVRVLWPLVEFEGYGTRRGLVGRTALYLGRYAARLADADALVPVVLYLAIFAAVGALWIVDGLPGVAELLDAVTPSRD